MCEVVNLKIIIKYVRKIENLWFSAIVGKIFMFK